MLADSESASAESASMLSLLEGWKTHVNSAVLQVISLAEFSLSVARGQVTKDGGSGGRPAARASQHEQELSLLAEELRIKDVRLARLAPHCRPHYTPVERSAILELRAARGWSLAQTAKRFFVTDATVAAWCKRIDVGGTERLLRMSTLVNKLPDFVRQSVQRLQARKTLPLLDSRRARRELLHYADWYNAHRPHTGLGGRTPDEDRNAQPNAAQQATYVTAADGS